MTDDLCLGTVNGHIVGRILKEAVRRAGVIAKLERDVFDSFTKPGYESNMSDVFTSADRKAQEIYLKTFLECFPNAGVIGEENQLRIEAKNGCRAYFTVDPIDGTRAYIRQQSHGIATMVALVIDGVVASAYIGDICADEVYGYRPGSSKVVRITNLDRVQELRAPDPKDMSELYVMLRDPPEEYDSHSRALLPRFKNYEVMGSSIGTWMARLWKREVGAMLLPGGTETPWDSTPIIGISLKLGYVFMRPVQGSGWETFDPPLPTEPFKRTHDTLIVHGTMAQQFEKSFAMT